MSRRTYTRIRTPLYARIQLQAGSILWSYIKQGFFPAVSGPCVDCGRKGTTYDHRDYDEPLAVAVVCDSCNQKRGQATFSVLDPDTLQRTVIRIGSAA